MVTTYETLLAAAGTSSLDSRHHDDADSARRAWFISDILGISNSRIGLISLFIVIDSKRITQA
ncbi:hypothetical protein [Methylophaga sp.]|uniref:hypothetical protein n=1 Tax=Methylophaga sp. TaxID=2024840 RepID=UPI003F69FBE0